jgi:hypothetical protein
MTAMMALVKLTSAFLMIGRNFLAVWTHLHHFLDGVENNLCPDRVHTSSIHTNATCCKADSYT